VREIDWCVACEWPEVAHDWVYEGSCEVVPMLLFPKDGPTVTVYDDTFNSEHEDPDAPHWTLDELGEATGKRPGTYRIERVEDD